MQINQSTDKKSVHYKLAKGIVSEIAASGKTGGKKLSHLVTRDMRTILRAYLFAKEWETDENALPVVLEWIADNHYVFEEEAAQIKKGLRSVKNIQGTTYGLPRFYLLALRYLKRLDGPLKEDALDDLIRAIDGTGDSRPAFNDLFSLELLIKAALITCTAEICAGVMGKNADLDNEKTARRLGNMVISLKYVSVHRFDNSFDRCETEEILKQDPSGFYGRMTKETKALYREQIARLAKKHRKDETEIAREIVEKSRRSTEQRKRHIGYFLVPKEKGGTLYFVLLFGITAALWGLCLLATPWALLVLFPLWEAVKQGLDALFARFFRSHPLPKLDLEEIPEEDGVLVVITTLLTGEKADAKLFDRLEKIYFANSGKNIYFGVLGDLSDSETATSSADEEILCYAKERIRALNARFGPQFFLFVRNRVYSKSEKKFIAWERKRGAVIELDRLLVGNSNHHFIPEESIDGKEALFKTIRYCITLDADTNLSLDSVYEMAGAMLHPLNRPVIDAQKGLVTEGYGIMQPKAAPELAAASKTPFSRLMCGVGGIDIYSTASFDLYQTLFGEGIFCGKGIFDKNAFYAVIDQDGKQGVAFPEDYILSHDALESARLRAALITDMELTDGFPKNELTYLKRQHRWIRGDVQNLKFLGRYYKTADGKRVPNTISGLNKFKLFDNFRRACVPIFALIGLCVAALTDGTASIVLTLVSLSSFVLPFLVDTFKLLTGLAGQCAARRFFSKGVTSGIWQSFLRTLFLIMMLPKSAICAADACARSFYRMATGRTLLEWVTAAQGEVGGKDTFFYYVQKNFIPSIIGFLFFLFAPVGVLTILGIMWFFLPCVAYFTAMDRKEIPEMSEDINKRLESYASDIWHFFRDNVNEKENDLPPDNIQIFPVENIAHRTSPTNIGLYLTSLLAARDFSLIDSEELYVRLSHTLATLDKMEKWKGHLFNWYDTETLRLLTPKYVSSVDSGNFIACLISVKEGVKQYVGEKCELMELIRQMEQLIQNTDFTAIYNEKRDLFSLGVSFENGKVAMSEGCYDLFMSEARITSYIAAASRKVPQVHWRKLSRLLIRSGGYLGLASWTGTAFEYFMPPLFLPVPKSSLSYEALLFALYAQRERRSTHDRNGIWGISESGFFAFDCDMNYQYKAFGVPLLGLKRGLEKDYVFAPYASFLTMCVSVKKSLVNLRRLYLAGMYGKYGFYEAVDYTPSRTGGEAAMVKSYMAHHLGMSMTALANARYGNLFVRRFMEDPQMACASELLEEKIPVNAVIRKVKTKFDVPDRPQRGNAVRGAYYDSYTLCRPHTALLSDGKAYAAISQTGHVFFQNQSVAVNARSSDYYELTDSFFTFFNIDGTCYSASPLPFPGQDCSYGFERTPGTASHCFAISPSGGDQKYHGTVKYTLTRNSAPVFRIRAELEYRGGQPPDTIETAFAFEPVLNSLSAHTSHPAFSSLFLSAEYESDAHILIFHRRPREEKEKELFLAVGFFESSLIPTFDTRKDDVANGLFTPETYRGIFDHAPKGNLGACIQPFCLMKTQLPNLSSHYACELLLAVGTGRDEVVEAIEKTRKESFEQSARELEDTALQFVMSAGSVSRSAGFVLSPEEMFCSACLFHDHTDREYSKEPTSIHHLWEHGISGDLPIACIRVGSEMLVPQLEKYIRAFKLLLLKNLRFDLVFLYSESERYYRPSENAILELISKCRADSYLRKHGGGIFLAEANSLVDRGRAIESFATLMLDVYSEREDEDTPPVILSPRIPICSMQKQEAAMPEIKPYLSVYGGYFGPSHSFVVTKHPSLVQPKCGPLESDDNREHGVPGQNAEPKGYAPPPSGTPYSQILAGRNIASVVTHHSLGYTFVRNASERRITPFDNDPAQDMKGERLLWERKGVLYDLIALSDYVIYSPGKAEYAGILFGVEYRVTVFVAETLSCKAIKVSLTQKEPHRNRTPSESDIAGMLYFAVEPIMGRFRRESIRVDLKAQDQAVIFTNRYSESFSQYTGFVTGWRIGKEPSARVLTDRRALYAQNKSADTADENTDLACIGLPLTHAKGEESSSYCFVLGAFKDTMRCPEDVFRSFAEHIDQQEEASVHFAKRFLPKAECFFNPAADPDASRSMQVMFNTWLPLQNALCRFLARSGFYQSGGAYGYRDQLQDCLALMYSAPDLTKAHLIRCAAHQFEEGDVQHWWHPDLDPAVVPEQGPLTGMLSHKGVRTRCSDDYLWLPFAVSEYLSYTGDQTILDVPVHYLQDATLAQGEYERYGVPHISAQKATVYEHCIRAIDYALKNLGAHGLPLLGTGDWSDGLNRAAKDLKGESVWLAMFLKLVLDRFAKTAERIGDTENQDRFHTLSDTLKARIAQTGYEQESGYYLRAFYDDGTPIGSSHSDECNIDLLPQAFCAIADCAEQDGRMASALTAGYRILFDQEVRITKLFAPAFEHTPKDPGYIKGYAAGLRENGGQYTHAAVWGALGLLKGGQLLYQRGEQENARTAAALSGKALLSLFPAYRMTDPALAARYRIEPYVLAGDIYSNPGHMGRGGWSWYTGAAGWMWRTMLNGMFGIEIKDLYGKSPCLVVNPERYLPLPELLCNGTVKLSFPHLQCECVVHFAEDSKGPAVTVENKHSASGIIPLKKGTINVTVVHPQRTDS